MDIPTIEVTLYGTTYRAIPSFSRYGNGRLAFQLYTDDGDTLATVTVNLPSDALWTDLDMFVKDYSENEELIPQLIAADWLFPLDRTVRSGFVKVPVMRLSGPLKAWYESLMPEEVQ